MKIQWFRREFLKTTGAAALLGAAAGGVALVNSVGNAGGFVGPYVVGYVRQMSQSFTSGMLVLAVTLVLAGILALRISD